MAGKRARGRSRSGRSPGSNTSTSSLPSWSGCTTTAVPAIVPATEAALRPVLHAHVALLVQSDCHLCCAACSKPASWPRCKRDWATRGPRSVRSRKLPAYSILERLHERIVSELREAELKPIGRDPRLRNVPGRFDGRRWQLRCRCCRS